MYYTCICTSCSLYESECCGISESDQLHEDVRKGRGTERMDEDNAPSNGEIANRLYCISKLVDYFEDRIICAAHCVQ